MTTCNVSREEVVIVEIEVATGPINVEEAATEVGVISSVVIVVVQTMVIRNVRHGSVKRAGVVVTMDGVGTVPTSDYAMAKMKTWQTTKVLNPIVTKLRTRAALYLMTLRLLRHSVLLRKRNSTT